MISFVHVNIIAHDAEKVISFYQNALGCKSIGQKRDLQGEWLDRMTGIKNAHLVGEHLLLPGYSENHPTLEIFSYDEVQGLGDSQINRCGFAHIAFEVEDVEAALAKVLEEGGGQLGELVCTTYEDGRKAVFVYATDCEGNIIELQSWNR